MRDITDVTWDRFFTERSKPLAERFPGFYRAQVVETNDPLNIGRLRIKCPDLHDSTLRPGDCPWATTAYDTGGFKAGRFSSHCIGDWVWVSFEKQHPYAPIVVGSADPTRTANYSLPSVHIETPSRLNVGVNDKNSDKRFTRLQDYNKDYLPKDRRPMAHGWVDRYGTMDVSSSVGYFPVEHDVTPPPPDHDALQNTAFNYNANKPVVNNPDKKYSARITKYGHMFIMGDQGYYWRKEANSELGEFTGNGELDLNWEQKRWLSLQKFINEGKPDTNKSQSDQRRVEVQTRYGHKIEMRDVGWAQMGPIKSKSREGEFGEPRVLSKETKSDQRWIKLRTKGGMLFQAYDKGSDPSKDKFITRSNSVEKGFGSEKEDKYWANKDARWVRLVTRHGFKIVLDDRGSSSTDADNKETPRGNGVLIKGRRSPGSKARVTKGDPRGFFWEFNENDAANHTTWGTPLGLAVEMNDRYQYMLLAASLGKGYSKKYRGLAENEFVGEPAMARNPERNSHHLKIDHDNAYIRFKTRGGRGTKADRQANPSGVTRSELNQGFEARDGERGDGPWVELVDSQERGLWLSKKYRIGVWRARNSRQMYMYMEEDKRHIVIFNNEQAGKITLFSNADIEIVSNKNIHLQAQNHIFMKAGRSITMQGGATSCRLANNKIDTNAIINADTVFARLPNTLPGAIGGESRPVATQVETVDAPILPSKLKPSDRGETYNKPFEACPREEIEHPI